MVKSEKEKKKRLEGEKKSVEEKSAQKKSAQKKNAEKNSVEKKRKYADAISATVLKRKKLPYVLLILS